MSTLMQRGATMLNSALGTGAGVTITYTRVAGGAAIEIDDAVVGRSSQTSQSASNGTGKASCVCGRKIMPSA